MGNGQNIGQIQIYSQEKTMATEKNQGLEGKILTQDEKTKQEQEEIEEETAEEEVTEKPEALEGEVTEEAPQEAEAKEEEVPEEIEKEEEKEKPAREKEAEEEEIVEERIYTIPLGKAWIMPPRRRTPRAMRMIRAFLMKHMKIGVKKEGEEEEEELPQLIISNEVNERVWGRGVEKPPRKIRVRAAKDKDGNVTVYLAEGD
jgi:large subunit ribosomal protein L31e